MKSRIYLDTSVISYFVARPSKDVIQQAHQKLSKEWWRQFHARHQLYISVYVLDEIEKGNKEAAAKRLKAIEGLPILDTSDSVERLAKVILKELSIPEKSRLDGYHLAIAALNSQDYIVSWNFKHMANSRVRSVFKMICSEEGIICPEISSPEEMIGGGL
jgi:predicted nucleic acid-binding protein